MKMSRKKLPIGIENFEKLRSDDFYYVDKTGLIRDLLNNWGEVNLFTRPRRFGKTLNMSMLEHFFSLEGDKSIFDGLEIAREKELCEKYMGKYPVVSVSLKGIDARTYETAYQMAVQIIMEAAAKFYFLLESEKLNEHEKAAYKDLLDKKMHEKIFTGYLRKTISIRDTDVRKEMKENFYHGVLLGILGVKSRWGVMSNREMGEGYADILAEPDTGDMGIIIEVKYAHDGDLEAACREALKQIEHTGYEDDLEDDGVEKILKYGIACYKKRCRVALA